jgi:hypothetical protein
MEQELYHQDGSHAKDGQPLGKATMRGFSASSYG